MIVPTKKNVAVKLVDKEKITKSGIILKSADPDEVNKGIVASIGNGVTVVSVGDMVLPNWNANIGKVTYEDEEYYIIPEKEIVAVYD
jgi:co-chaperonin GroES (HSP10)